MFREGTITTVVPAVAALLDPELLKCVVDPWYIPPEVAHACPPLDQCAGSRVTYICMDGDRFVHCHRERAGAVMVIVKVGYYVF